MAPVDCNSLFAPPAGLVSNLGQAQGPVRYKTTPPLTGG